MTVVGEAFVAIRPDTKGFESEAKKSVGASVKGIAVTAAATFAAVGLASFAKGSIAAITESNKIAAQTDAVIKSTRSSAHLTADEIGNLATALSRKTAIDDEAIQAGENMLLTFTNVRNEVGKGNNIFDQATGTILDMSVALGQDTKASAIQLGKALNDPIKGVTALQRVGVTFTDKQKEQIKALVESGDVLGAQKIILKELGKEFGGSAAAAATPLAQLKVTVGNLQESLGRALLPTVNSVVKALDKFLPVIEPWLPIILPVIGAIGAIVVATRIWTAVQAAWTVIMEANPIGLVVIAIAALVAIVVIAYKNSQTFRDIVQSAWDVLKGIAGFIADVVVGSFKFLSDTITGLFGWIRNNWPLLLAILTGPFGLAVKFIVDHWDGIVGFFAGVPGRISAIAKGMWNGISDAFKAAINVIIRGWNSLEFKVPGFNAGPIHFGGFTLGVPDIPKLHEGGVFRAPHGRNEGLALLRDGERVSTPEQSASSRPIVFQTYLDGKLVAEQVYDPLRRLNAGTA